VDPRHTYNPVPRLEDDPEERPDDTAFDIHGVAAVSQGDWPPMVTGCLLDLLPKGPVEQVR
jgi:hypothetical protein